MAEETKTVTNPKAKPSPHPKDLSAEYHRAHKQLMLWAAILFVWEFVGIDLEKAKDAEGYAGALVKSIKSPQAVPWVLLFLVFYFLFKCTTEWAQCHSDRRKMRFARADFASAWILGVGAIALYFVQALGRVQFADLIQERRWFVIYLLMGGFSGVLSGFALFDWAMTYYLKDLPQRMATMRRRYAIYRFGVGVLPLLLIPLVPWLSGFPFSWRAILIGFVAMLPIFLLARVLWYWFEKRRIKVPWLGKFGLAPPEL